MTQQLDELIARSKARMAAMSPAELEAMRQEQARSWARGMAPCEHGLADWEDCPDCRELALKAADKSRRQK